MKRLLLTLTLAAVLCGCGSKVTGPPVTVSQYERLERTQLPTYPDHMVFTYNVQRVLDTDLPAADRLESMKLVARVDADEPGAARRLSGVLDEPDAPPELVQAVSNYLLRSGRPELAGHVAGVLPRLRNADPAVRRSALDYLTQNPTPEMLSEVVKLWADEPVNGPDEQRYRQIVERMTGKPWDSSLLSSLNSSGFFARGSALEILSARLSESALSGRIERLIPQTEAVRTLRSFVENFDYVPETAEQFITAVSLYKTRRGLFRDAAELARDWKSRYGYEFRIRDFHLISRLAGDPLRTMLSREQLLVELSESLQRRRTPDDYRRGGGEDRLAAQAERLSVPDLWNLHLLDRMLRRQRVQLALRVMAERDRADEDSAWGGLVFYENGQAEAKLYPPDPDAPTDDRTYVPSRMAEVDARDALCMFHARFDRARNAAAMGPTSADLQAARREDRYALVLTGLSDKEFVAHYYNPDGEVVSLGALPFRE